MNTKKCFKCNNILPLESFYKHPQMRDGRVNKCKECNKNDVKNNRRDRIDYYREYDRNRAIEPHRIAARIEYQQTAAGKNSMNRAKIKWADINHIKRGANHIVNNAVRDGKLIKPNICESCNTESKRIHGHHCDYAKPLDVMWLCPGCHTKWHKINKSING